MRGYLIDPWEREVKLVDVPADDLDGQYELLSHAENAVESIDAVMLPNGVDSLYVDEDALTKLEITEPYPGAMLPSMPAFTILGYPQPFFGKGLVIGTTEDGDDADATILEGALHAMVQWVAPATAAAWLMGR